MNGRYVIFNTWHPGVLFAYALAGPVLGMLTLHPLFLALNLGMAVVMHWFYQGGGRTLQRVAGLLPVTAVIVLFNFCLNTRGRHVLFQIGQHPFTLESLSYGLASGCMLSAVLLWFQSFSFIVSNEKFLYLFGRRLPGTALLLSMILKLFPDTGYRIRSIRYADREPLGAGKSPAGKRIRKGLKQMSTLMEWSMEDSIEMADSMKARGYGEGRRTCWQQYRFSAADAGMSLWFAAAGAVCLWGMFFAGTGIRWYPEIRMQGEPGKMMVTGAVYLLFLATPLLVEGKGRWNRCT